MSSAIILERFKCFLNKIKQNRYPNAGLMAEHFEITGKTAQRNIAFLRDRLHAPLRYLPSRRGYELEDQTWVLPGLWMSEDELISLILSYRLASAVPDSNVKESLHRFLNHVIAAHSAEHLSIEELGDKISVKNIAYSRAGETVFHRLLEALLRAKTVCISYYSPHNDQSTLRDILPLHLLNYMGTWHIIAYCNNKKQLRDFVLSRVQSVLAITSSL